ncbi:MAG: HAD family hydrolase [Lacibacter sp.]|jgi:beta-phosphoglucomutase family hydrolase
MQKAFVFDLNGTMIDDMEYHIRAWHSILNELGANLSYEETKQQCFGKNHELLERIFPGRFSPEEKNKLSIEKEKNYQKTFQPRLQLIDELDSFLKKAKAANIPIAIGSAAIMFNIDFVLDGLHIRQYIDAIVSSDDVSYSKPHPETFIKCAEKLGVPPEACIVFEDAPKGVEAAAAAGMRAVVITSTHEKHEFHCFPNVVRFIENYHNLNIHEL